MPKRVIPITVKELKKLKDGRHAVGGAPNLYVDIKNGSISFWLLRHQKDATKNITYPSFMTLEQVRDRARQDLELLKQGENPRERRKALIEAEKQKIEENRLKDLEASATLETVTNQWLKNEIKANRWKDNHNGATKEYNRLKKDVFPIFGTRPVNTITAQEMAEFFNDFYLSKHSTAERVLHYLKLIYAWARASKQFGRVENPFNEEFEELTRTAKTNKPIRTNHPALPFNEIPSFIKALLELGDTVSLAIVFSILTATRNKAVRLSSWKEIDFKNKTWIVSRENDKKKRPEPEFRTVFLSDLAIDFLKKLPRLTNKGDELLFPPNPARPFSPMTDNTIGKHIRDLHARKKLIDGIGWIDPKIIDENTGEPRHITQHGTARSGLQTWAREKFNKYDDRAVDLCLFHVTKGNYSGAYDRNLMESQRKLIMRDWAKHCLKGIKLSAYKFRP